MGFSHITIPAEDLETQGVFHFDQGGIKAMPATRLGYLPSVFIAFTVDMVQSQKFQFGFPTTLTVGAIVGENFCLKSSLIRLGCLQASFCVSFIPCSSIGSVTFGVSLLIGALLFMTTTAEGYFVNQRLVSASATSTGQNTPLLTSLLCTECR